MTPSDLVVNAKLYDIVAQPLFPSKEHRTISFLCIWAAMGATVLQHTTVLGVRRSTEIDRSFGKSRKSHAQSRKSHASSRRALLQNVAARLRAQVSRKCSPLVRRPPRASVPLVRRPPRREIAVEHLEGEQHLELRGAVRVATGV